MDNKNQRESLKSRIGFILLAAGCAIGLGNVWRFPFITGKYGGGAFVVIYLIFLIILGAPIMVMELAIGRAARHNIGKAMKTLQPAGTKWHIYGHTAIAGNYLLMMFYTTVLRQQGQDFCRHERPYDSYRMSEIADDCSQAGQVRQSGQGQISGS
jgi:NSS family neurotransmitter:Na+ symporter